MTQPNSSIKDLASIRYNAVGKCIYCNATEKLTCEHIVPCGLGGTAELPQSSCKRCATETGRFEQAVLRGPMWAARKFLGLKSRTKHKDGPKTLPLDLNRGSDVVTIEVPLHEHPLPVYFPVFDAPGYFQLDNYRCGIRTRGVVGIRFGPDPNELIKKFNAQGLSMSAVEKWVEFARMVAKIGYSWAVAEGQIQKLRSDPFPLAAIRGDSDDIGRWVGTLDKPLQKHAGQLHRLAIHTDTEKGLLIAEIQLFAESETPSYGILLGRLT